MRNLVPMWVGLVSTSGNKLLLPITRLTTLTRCYANCNVFNSSKSSYIITRSAKLFGGQYNFSTADRPYFNLGCTSRHHSSVTALTININSERYVNNQPRRRKVLVANCMTCCTASRLMRRIGSPYQETGSSRLLNVFGVRNFNVGGPSAPLLTASKEKKGIVDRTLSSSSSPPGQSNNLQFTTPREFMEAHGVEAGNYVNFLLQMTPLQDEEQPHVYRGSPLYVHPKRPVAFGGCLLGQALSAAVRSVPQGQLVHSLHNYFLNAGRRGSVDYHVKITRDGNTYCNRFVQGMQNGETIVNMQVSFKKDETDPFHHQYVMPDCKKPEELVSASELVEKKLSEDLSEELKKILKYRLPIDPIVEFRPVDEEAIYRLKPLPPKRLTWVKIIEKLDDDQNFHRCAMAFLSDYIILTTALLPNENNLQKYFVTSLDHSIWFHNNVRADQWLLYETESCHSGGGTGFATGRFWSADGVLVASLAQQGVIRSLL